MSSESAPKIRFVLCPKCRQVLQESPDFDVYKCGGCGTVLQAKKRRSGAVNSKSSTRETNAASRNALNPVSDDKQQNKGEQLFDSKANGLRVEATSSSSGECSSDGNNERDQVENGKCDGKQVVPPQENGDREKATRPSSGDCSLVGNDGKVQIENGECNGDRVVLPLENGEREKGARSSSRDCSLDGDGGSSQVEKGECNREQAVLHQENSFGAKPTSSSSAESSFNGSLERDQIENGKCNEDQIVENGLKVKATSSISGEYSLGRNGGSDQIQNDECDGKQLGPHNLSDEELEKEMSEKGCSNELTKLDTKASTEQIVENSVKNPNHTVSQLPKEESSKENFQSEVAGEDLNSEDVNDEKSSLVGVNFEVNITRSDLEGAEEADDEKSALAGKIPDITGSNKAEAEKELTRYKSYGEGPKSDQSALVCANSEVEIIGSASTSKSSSTETFESEKGNIAHCKSEERKSDDVSPRNKHWRHGQNIVRHSFDSVRSVDTSDAIEVINLSSELRGNIGENSKSPTTRSSHAYEGSVSSNDGVDEGFPSRQLDSLDNTHTVANGVLEERS